MTLHKTSVSKPWRHLLALLATVACMTLAAITVNKTIFNIPFERPTATNVPTDTEQSDTLTTNPDGTVTIHTAPLCQTQGYAGKVPLDVTFSPQGKIISIKILDNDETPSFLNRASTLLDHYTGATAQQAATMHVDAVTGATYTSQALTDGVSAAAEFHLAHFQNQKPTAQQARGPEPLPVKLWVALAVTLAACIVPLLTCNKYYRMVQMVANVIVLGFWSAQFLDYHLMLRYLSTGITLPAGIIAILMLCAAFIYPFFGRPQHYCNHICPLGSAQLLMARVSPFKLRLKPLTIKVLEIFRRVLWATLMLLLWLNVATVWLDYELFQAFIPETAPLAITIVAGAFILLSAIIPRPYCRFVCPTGTLFRMAENRP